MVCGRCSHHTEAVRVVAEAIKKWLYTFDAQGVDRADDAARAAVEALYAATVEPDCPTCGGRSTDQSDLAVERFNRTGNLTDCPNPDCSNGKLPSRYLVVVDAERDGKLVRHPWSDAVLCEVPPEEGADR